MAISDLSKTPTSPETPSPVDCREISRLGDDPAAWPGLDDEALQQVVSLKILEYGITEDTGRIAGLSALYCHLMERIPVPGRHRMLKELSELIGNHGGLGHMGLRMFLAAEADPGIRASAAFHLSILYNPAAMDQGELAGPRLVVRSLVHFDSGGAGQGTALSGVLRLGDRRVMPFLEEIWDKIPESSKLEMAAANYAIVTEGIVEFWLGRLEAGCSDGLFNAVVAALVRMPLAAHVPWVVDLEQTFPAHASPEPVRLLRRTSFPDFLERMLPRLKSLPRLQADPTGIFKLQTAWSHPSREGHHP